jgi:hypothetical protein
LREVLRVCLQVDLRWDKGCFDGVDARLVIYEDHTVVLAIEALSESDGYFICGDDDLAVFKGGSSRTYVDQQNCSVVSRAKKPHLRSIV